MKIHSTVIGSYPRPLWVRWQLLKLQGRQKEDADKLGNNVEDVFKKATLEILKDHESAKIDIATDGQLRWTDFLVHVAEKIEGIKMGGLIRFFDNNVYYRNPIIKSQIKWLSPVLSNDYEFASKNSKLNLKVAIPGPYTLYKLSNSIGFNKNEILHQFTDIIKSEVEALVKSGCKIIQIDEPSIVYNPPSRDEFILLKEELNRIFKNLEVTKMLYTYFAPPTEKICDILDIDFDVLGMDFVNSNKGFNFIKEHRIEKDISLGIVNARDIKIEDRIKTSEKAQKIINVTNADNIYINTNCGLIFLPQEYAFKKLKIVTDITKKLRNDNE